MLVSLHTERRGGPECPSSSIRSLAFTAFRLPFRQRVSGLGAGRAVSDSVQVAFDLGAESGRAIVGRFDGRRVELEEARRFENRAVRLPDGLYWDALGLYAELCSSLGEIGADGRHGPEHRHRLVGLRLRPARPAPGRCSRARSITATGAARRRWTRAFSRVPAAEIYEETGIQFLPFNTLFQLIALEGSARLDAAETLLLIPDLLGFWLSGERVVRGHEREHDAAARRPDRRVVSRPDRAARHPVQALRGRQGAGRGDRRAPAARRGGDAAARIDAARHGRLPRHGLGRRRRSVRAGEPCRLHLERNLVARRSRARPAVRLGGGAGREPDERARLRRQRSAC